jgi:hypothetical protein
MARWDAEKGDIVEFAPQPYGEHYPNWELVDCGCCMGIEWGGDSPRECEYCRGSGMIAHHKPSGLLTLYPGGPICGRI